MIKFTLDIVKDGISPKLRKLASGLDNLSAFNSDAALIMESRVKEYFAQQAGPNGSWAALAPSTIAKKGSGAILRETGAMVNAVSSSYSSSSAKVTQGMAYAIFSQYGTSRQPAREHLGFDSELESRLKQGFQSYLEGLL